MRNLWPLLAFLVSVETMMGCCALTPSSFISTGDRQRLLKVFADSLNSKAGDLSSVAHAILGYKLLGETVPNAKPLCQKLQTFADAADATASTAYQVAASAKELPGGGCSIKLGTKASEAVNDVLAGTSVTVDDLYHACLAQINLGKTPVDKASVAKLLFAALKRDDSVAGLGYAFNLALHLNDADAALVFERIEDAIVQADEVDGRMLQFEGGLSVTHLVVNGAYKLADRMGSKPPPITKTQAVKFANYFLSRKSVQRSDNAYYLLKTLHTLTNNKFQVAVSVSLAASATTSNVVSKSSPNVRIKVTDLMGGSLGRMIVTVESVVMPKTKMTPVVGNDDTLYEVDVFSAASGRGFYDLAVTAVPAQPDERLVGNSGAVLTVKALCEMAIEDVELGVADAGQSVAPKLNSLKFPAKFATVLKADHHHKVVLKFGVRDKTSQDRIKVHQAFVSLVNVATGSEIAFVAEPSAADNLYKFELSVGDKIKEFAGASGRYEINLFLGDAVVSNPLSWNLADVELSFQDQQQKLEEMNDVEFAAEAPVAAEAAAAKDRVKPEIFHKFKEPEKCPRAIVSNGFTVLCLLPLVLLLAGWVWLRVNLLDFPFCSISAVGFHVGLGSIFGLYYRFWLNLDMFTTIKYLVTIGIVTFSFGNSMLSKIADKRKNL